jgi:hypothetical protein
LLALRLATNPFAVVLYDNIGGHLADSPILVPPPYFNNKSQYSAFVSNWDPTSKSDESRLWTDDINQDGKPDVIVSLKFGPVGKVSFNF